MPGAIIALSVQELVLKELVLYEFVMVPTNFCINFFSTACGVHPALKKKSFSRPLRQLYSEYISCPAGRKGEGVAAVSC
jgi:hypothetical protein